MSNRFTQRGGWWVVGQFMLMLAIALLGIVCRDESKHRLLLLSRGDLPGDRCDLWRWRHNGLGAKPDAVSKTVGWDNPDSARPYGLLRQPLYTAVIYAALGWSLIRSSWSAFAVSLALAIFFDTKARHEELWLRRQFPDYEIYEQRVRRFIPWI